jgi:hypothetical protein
VKRLNADTAEDAMRMPEKFSKEPGEPLKSVSGKLELKLAPYEVARVDVM